MSASRPADTPTEPQIPQAAPRRRRPRKLNREPVSRRPESAGGVALPPTSPSPPPSIPPTQSPASAPSTTPVPRRQPRKLNTPAAAPKSTQPTQPVQSAQPNGHEPAQHRAESNGGVPVNHELEALKTRVQELEAQVQELYARPATAKSPRKRGQGRKKPEATDLQRVQDELEAARRELETVRARGGSTPASIGGSPVPTRSESQRSGVLIEAEEEREEEDDDDAETITRSDIPTVSAQPARAVSLSGSYSLRLPDSLSMDDVRAIQNGVTSAGNIARSLAAEYNAWQSSRPDGTGSASWSQWFGSCSASVARIARQVDGEAFVEWRTRSQTDEKESPAEVPSTSRTSGGIGSAAETSSTGRPALKGRTSTSSSTSRMTKELLM